MGPSWYENPPKPAGFLNRLQERSGTNSCWTLNGVYGTCTCAPPNVTVPSMSDQAGPTCQAALPAGLHGARRVSVDSELAGNVDPDGRILFATAESAQAQVWAGSPALHGDSQESIRRFRELDMTIEAENAARRAHLDGDAAAGVRLLASLGLR